MKRKTIIIAEAVLLILVISVIYAIAPHTDYPKDNVMTGQSIIEFKTDNAEIILIDDNPDFSSPIEINLKEKNTTKARLEPGTYYWKAIGVLESSVKKFTILSKVSLELSNSTLTNTGNLPLNVTKKNIEGSEDLVILEVSADYILNSTNETVIYQGEQYDK